MSLAPFATISQRLAGYLLLLSILTVAVVGLSYGTSLSTAAAHNEQLAHEMGRVVFQVLLITRRWNAQQDGVYVPLSDEVQPNPYLKDPQRDVVTTTGVRLTKVNPAFMTRLLSAVSEQSNGVHFHITSLNPINPSNAPDDWERKALERFAAGATEQFGLVAEAAGPVFRFMGRLTVEQKCLKCHEQQGYKEGDVRGGIRVSLPWAPFQATLEASRRQLSLLHGAALAGVLTLLWVGGLVVLRAAREVDGLNRQMKTLNQRLELSALTDSLTGVANRRHFDRMLDAAIGGQARRYEDALSLIMIDLDHFKRVNDTHGHAVGDLVLRDFAQLMQTCLRPTDLLARWGGEEFAVAAPRTDLESALRLAERLRAAVLAHGFPVIGTLSISLGVAAYRTQDTALTLLERADAALYRAKELGRNRVAAADPR